MHNLSCENEFSLQYENEKWFPYQRLHEHLPSFWNRGLVQLRNGLIRTWLICWLKTIKGLSEKDVSSRSRRKFQMLSINYYVVCICLNLQLRILALTQFLEFEQSLFCLKICEWAHCVYVIMSTPLEVAIAVGHWVAWHAVQAMQLYGCLFAPTYRFSSTGEAARVYVFQSFNV